MRAAMEPTVLRGGPRHTPRARRAHRCAHAAADSGSCDRYPNQRGIQLRGPLFDHLGASARVVGQDVCKPQPTGQVQGRLYQAVRHGIGVVDSQTLDGHPVRDPPEPFLEGQHASPQVGSEAAAVHTCSAALNRVPV